MDQDIILYKFDIQTFNEDSSPSLHLSKCKFYHVDCSLNVIACLPESQILFDHKNYKISIYNNEIPQDKLYCIEPWINKQSPSIMFSIYQINVEDLKMNDLMIKFHDDSRYFFSLTNLYPVLRTYNNEFIIMSGIISSDIYIKGSKINIGRILELGG